MANSKSEMAPVSEVSLECVHVALQLCCGSNRRHDLRRPWLHDGRVYASDGIVIASVPADCAPWVTAADYPGRRVPGVTSLPWASDLYSNRKAGIPPFKQHGIEPCSVCFSEAREDCPPSIYEAIEAEHAAPCPKCGTWTADPTRGDAVKIEHALFSPLVLNRLRTIGVDLYPPLNPGKDNAAAWRWEQPDIRMVGLVMPMRDGQ